MGLFELTPRAKEELFALAAHPEHKGKGIRIFVEGFPHEEKTCWILFEEKPRVVDRIFVEDGLTLIVGPESGWYLKGKELDFEPAEGGGAFIIAPIPSFEEVYDGAEWAFLDDLPAEEEPWDDEDWELVPDDEDGERAPERRPSSPPSPGPAGTRLPRGWRPAP